MKFSLVTVDSGSDKDYQYNFIWLFKFVSDLDRCFLVGNLSFLWQQYHEINGLALKVPMNTHIQSLEVMQI